MLSPSPHVRSWRRVSCPAGVPDRPPAVAQETWTAVDEYVTGLLAPPTRRWRRRCGRARRPGCPQIQVSPPQGKLLYLLAKTIGAKLDPRVRHPGRLQHDLAGAGTAGGGRLITLEAEPRYAEVAAASIAAAGLGDIVEVRVGPGAGAAAAARGRGGRSLRPDLHRRRQGPHARVLRLVAGALTARQPDRRRQRRPRRRASRTPTTTTRRSPPSAASTRCSPPSPASRRRRSRQSAARATTASASPAWR